MKKSETENTYIPGQAKCMRQLHKLINQVAPTDYSIILIGETGTGKEETARLIHKNSKRKEGPFIAIDCGCLSPDIAGSELFGHVKGAFTGASSDKTGLFELSNGGTIFLDEIANLSLDVQTMLLRSIQQRTACKIGCLQETALDIRIIAAANQNLLDLCHKGKFRLDLYYRLNEMELTIPPLREREQDMEKMAEIFATRLAKQLNKKIKGFSDSAIKTMKAYSWPGNIRELKNFIKKACLLTPDDNYIDHDVFNMILKVNVPEVHNEVPDNVPVF
jgi:two-component system response regulator HydG